MIAVPVRTEVLMGTIVTIDVVRNTPGDCIDRAFAWFREIESRCTRFDDRSELRQLSRRVGEPLAVSDILFEAVRFAVAVAHDTDGAFDPTIQSVATDAVSYRDVVVDSHARTITLQRPLTLDLGAVAKGLAIDAAARELQRFGDFAIDAGGDVYAAGHNAGGVQWSIGIRHPRADRELIDVMHVSGMAVCSSGDYERGAHILDGRSRTPARAVASATVIAAHAMLADALATAAFVLGPQEGLALLQRHGVEGLIITPSLERFETANLPRA